jgi:asparagine synthase (glutamine-hydrolysing)
MPSSSTQKLIMDYVGFRGQRDFAADGRETQHYTLRLSKEAPVLQKEHTILQLLHPSLENVQPVPQPGEHAYLLLSGTLLQEEARHKITAQIVFALTSGHYDQLARIQGDYVGCLLTLRQVFFFKSLTSNENLFYRKQGTHLTWSTDPADLIENAEEEIHDDTLRLCCTGEDTFIYHHLNYVQAGNVVMISRDTIESKAFDQISALDLPRYLRLGDFAEMTRDLVLRATRPIANSGRVGVMLSGGIDSSSVLAALVEHGADVVAYHLDTDDSLSNEALYAREVCLHLSVPFIPIQANGRKENFSWQWSFPHPYNHAGYRWLEKIADQASQDGVSIIASGRFGDDMFGAMRYGLYDVLHGDIRWHEKIAMCIGAVSTRWLLPDLLKSLHKSQPLRAEGSVPAENRRQANFLTPAAVAHAQSCKELFFSPQDCVTELTLWRPRGIRACHPLGSKAIQQFSLSLPCAYRLIPFQSQFITKPALRLAFSQSLPPLVWKRLGRSWTDAPVQNFCLDNVPLLHTLLGGTDSLLVRKGIIEPAHLADILTHPKTIRVNAQALICSAMTELFLRNLTHYIASTGGKAHVSTHIG